MENEDVQTVGLMESSSIPVASASQIDAAYCLHFLRKIRDVVFATTGEDGHPSARVIDVMHADDERLYFLTARGKTFYADLVRTGFVAIAGQTTDFRTCKLRGPVVHPEGEAEQRRLVDWMFELNPGMADLYPGESRYVIEVFYLEQGEGDYFDLGQKPLVQVHFTLGGGDGSSDEATGAYYITEACTGCGTCAQACPQGCIHETENGTYAIDESACLKCGLCMETCPFGAVARR